MRGIAWILLIITFVPGVSIRNANPVAPGMPFNVGGSCEVVIEGSPRLTPGADVWQDVGNTILAGTAIPPGA